jgi:hypothetical protein
LQTAPEPEAADGGLPARRLDDEHHARAGDCLHAPRLQYREHLQGDPRITFVVGAILSFPGLSYLTALDKIHHLNPGTVPTVLLVIAFCLMQQILLEIPLLGYVFAPDRTQDTITRFKAWVARKGRPAAVIAAAVIGVILIARGLITLL